MKARTPQRSRLWWTIVALAMPVVVVGSLLGLTSSADTALERIPVALVNNDELVETTNDDGEEEIILASKPLITELVSGDGTEVEWVITSTEAAESPSASPFPGSAATDRVRQISSARKYSPTPMTWKFWRASPRAEGRPCHSNCSPSGSAAGNAPGWAPSSCSEGCIRTGAQPGTLSRRGNHRRSRP